MIDKSEITYDSRSVTMTRRTLLGGLLLVPAGCATPPSGDLGPVTAGGMYGSVTSEPYAIEAVDLADRDPSLARQEVAFGKPYKPGTIVVSIPERRLYLVRPGGRAIRYAVGVGPRRSISVVPPSSAARPNGRAGPPPPT